jgi:hypothetical protein
MAPLGCEQASWLLLNYPISLIVIEKMKKSETLDFEEQDVNSMPTSILLHGYTFP